MRAICLAAALLCIAASAAMAHADEAQLSSYRIDDDAVSAPLGGRRGDATRGAALINDRQHSLCVLCHRGPFPNPHLQGDLGPDLSGVGSRLTEEQIRLRVIDMKALNPDSIMPSYHRVRDGERTAAAWRGKPILRADEVEDLVAYLVTLRN